MTSAALVLADLVAVTILVFGLYFPRHHRRNMVVAILGLNVGVMAVATALATAEVSAGLGLGLFGVLSIIRLRSTELAQEDIAYYFTALALGLLGGTGGSPGWVTPALMGAILVVLFVADHPRLFASHRTQTITLDRAYPNELAATQHVQGLLGAEVTRLRIKRLDLVRDTTIVEVCFKLNDATPADDPPVEHPEFSGAVPN